MSYPNIKIQIHILRGPGEEKDALALKNEGDSIIPDKSIKQMISTIKRGDIIISGDTGPLHIAAAEKIPSVSLFGPTDFNRNGAYNCITTTIYSKLKCMNCYKRKCNNWTCMPSLSPKIVAETTLSLISSIDIKR